MTREEEAIQNLKRAKCVPYKKETLTVAIKSLEEKTWIPCSERMPNIGEDILFSVADLYTAEGCLRDDGDYCQFRWNSIIPKDRVTAWMPLPEPYKGVEE